MVSGGVERSPAAPVFEACSTNRRANVGGLALAAIVTARPAEPFIFLANDFSSLSVRS